MNDLISKSALNEAMYHEAFETDSDMQKWDSGCWIRYKMFENALAAAPTIDAVPVVRCKDCRWKEEEQPGMVYCPATVGGWVDEDWFCKGGERSEE